MTHIFDVMAILGAAAISGVIKLWVDNEKLKTQMRNVDARLSKIDDLKLEGSLAEIKTELTHIRAILEGRMQK